MRHVIGGVLAALAVGLLLPPSAAGASSRTDVAIQVAVAKWGLPCGGDVTYQWGPLDPPLAGLARWWWWKDGDPPDLWFDCTVTIDQTRARHWRDEDFVTYCGFFVHEVGHLRGQPHSENPRSIMAPVITTRWRHCITAARQHGWQ